MNYSPVLNQENPSFDPFDLYGRPAPGKGLAHDWFTPHIVQSPTPLCPALSRTSWTALTVESTPQPTRDCPNPTNPLLHSPTLLLPTLRPQNLPLHPPLCINQQNNLTLINLNSPTSTSHNKTIITSHSSPTITDPRDRTTTNLNDQTTTNLKDQTTTYLNNQTTTSPNIPLTINNPTDPQQPYLPIGALPPVPPSTPASTPPIHHLKSTRTPHPRPPTRNHQQN